MKTDTLRLKKKRTEITDTEAFFDFVGISAQEIKDQIDAYEERTGKKPVDLLVTLPTGSLFGIPLLYDFDE